MPSLPSTIRWFPDRTMPGILFVMRGLQRTVSILLLGIPLLVSCSGDDDDDGSPQADADIATPDADPAVVLEFMATCDVSNDQCDMANDHFCFAFNSKGPHCTHACVGPEDCEAPSTGCNNRGVCKAP